ncbi:MAG: hypothetical protein WC807_05740 [Hyphomicrobium sp.]
MRNRAVISLALLAAAVSALPAPAYAQAPRRHSMPAYGDGAGPQGVGCYWMRERLYCARYCYVEVDGRRYCRERSRLAFPQAPPFYEDVPRNRLK